MTARPPDPARTARFEATFARVHGPLQRYLRRRTDPATADDVLAEALATIWRRLDDLPAGMELAWCYSVARHTLANHRRADARRLRLVERIGEAAGRRPDPMSGPEAVLGGDDPRLDAALARLADDDREVLRLWAWEQLEAREIAAVLAITPNAASIRLHRAKTRLREALVAGGDGEPERAGPEVDTDGAGPGGRTR